MKTGEEVLETDEHGNIKDVVEKTPNDEEEAVPATDLSF